MSMIFKQLRNCNTGDMIRNRDGEWGVVGEDCTPLIRDVMLQSMIPDNLVTEMYISEWVLVIDTNELDYLTKASELTYPRFIAEQETK